MQAGHIGLSLTAPRKVAGGGGPPPAAVVSLEIVSATPLLDQTGDYGDATSRIGVNGNGWVGKAVVTDDGASTFDPSKFSLAVSDPGYDGTGSTTVNRTITGTAILRRQWAQEAARMNAAPGGVGTDRTVFFALSDDIYAGTTIISATAAAGFYGAATDGAISSVTNSSTKAYEKPMVAWLNPQHDRATGAFNVEAVAYHRRMRSGRQVARIEFIAKDSQGTPNVAATQTANSTSLSAFCTQGQPPDAYKASIPITALTQGDLCFVRRIVYPWLGDSSAIYDDDVDGVSITGACTVATPLTTLRFLNDKSGTYGGGHAAFKTGAVGGTVQATYALAVLTPFPSGSQAIAALPAWNTANKTGNTTHSGSTVWAMEDSPGAGANHSTANSGIIAGMSGVTAGLCWTDIRVDPAAIGAVKMTMAVTRTTADLLRWFVNIDHTAGNGLDGSTVPNDKRAAFENLTVDLTGTTTTVPICYRTGLHYLRNVSFTNVGNNADRIPGHASITMRSMPALWLGVLATDLAANKILAPFTMVGCKTKRCVFQDVDLATITTWESGDGAFLQNNFFTDARALSSTGQTEDIVKGKAYLQNIIERCTATTGAFNIGGDGTGRSIRNVGLAYNTVPGLSTDAIARVNRYYNDADGSQGDIKDGNDFYNLFQQVNSKRDTFVSDSTLTGRVGSWRFNYSVGNVGDVVCAGSGSGTSPSLSGGTWLGERWPAATYNVGNANVGFASNQAGSAGAGNGDYHLVSAGTNAAYNQVPAGFAGLGHDIYGATRLNDGTGAAGASEKP